MTLRELLEELRNNVLRDRSTEEAAQADGYLWSNATLVRYINDAEQKFARRTHCLRDRSTPEVVEVALVPGVSQYALHPSVIAVLGATWRAGPLRRSDAAVLEGVPADISGGTRAPQATATGQPVWFTTDEEVRTLRVYPAPDTAETVYLRVARLPLNPLTPNNLTASPEIPEDYHLDLLEWAAWRALRNHDTDAENMAKASAHKRRFEEAVDELRRASKRLMLEPIQFAVCARYD